MFAHPFNLITLARRHLLLRFPTISGIGSADNSLPCRGESDQSCAMAVGVIQAHPNGIADLAIMANARDSCAFLSPNGGDGEEVGGLLMTCGSGEGTVKIWDYTHVEDDGRCGR